MPSETTRVGQIHAITTDSTTHIQLPPPTTGARRLWNGLRSRLTGKGVPEHTSIHLSRSALSLPDTQPIPLEDIDDLSVDGGLSVRWGAGQADVPTTLSADEARWLRITLRAHIARRRAALSMMRELRGR